MHFQIYKVRNICIYKYLHNDDLFDDGVIITHDLVTFFQDTFFLIKLKTMNSVHTFQNNVAFLTIHLLFKIICDVYQASNQL